MIGMAKWRSYFKHAVNVHRLLWPPFGSLACTFTIALAFGAKRLAK
jgi:hypothetical protein